ncbi:hypothetical protein [Candidatus Nitrosotenuis uzonensis]|uniref:Uncharacterized protein n=1 Tax=Candidatus Nitrosotenuis uzonensis TaxID=1407055 RepID=V6AVK8_9ARCH|nr:hypothetical protein [Candidatus Nitrosotenuis uzonensis]CDI06598.1 conserved hypothetical protein [Candidatus Nitrosotenuis uzonensis]
MRKLVIAAVAVIIVIVLGLILTPSEKTARTQIYHVRLADPDMYKDGIYSETFQIKKGIYEFRFVPNGDSPQTLSIALKGPTFSFAEDFKLEGTPHDTGISRYYTWEYIGESTIQVPDDQQLEILINPHGNLLGPVSVYLIE